MLIAFMISTLTNIFDVLNISTGEFKKQIKGRMIFSLFLILICLISVKNGILAVSLGILLYQLTFFFYTFSLSKKRLRLNWVFLVDCILPAITCSGIMFVVVKFLSIYFFSEYNLINFLSLVFCGVAIYASSFFCHKFFSNSFY